MALPKLSPQQPIAGDLKPTSPFLQFMEATRRAVEDADTRLQTAINDLATQVARLTVQTIGTSYANGLTITASADGATAKVVISSHTRVYTDTTASVTGATISGLAYGETYSVYYDDEDRSGGAVSYVTTTNPGNAVTSATNRFRHFVGAFTTPAASGDPPIDGGGSLPPSFPGGIYEYQTP
jgi:hypothetical protein